MQTFKMMSNNNFLINFDRKCRICASDLLDITCAISIFSGIGLEQKIQKYLYIRVTPDDELPKVICATCFIKIESIDKFAHLAAKTEETYSTWLKKAKEGSILITANRVVGKKKHEGKDTSDNQHKLILKTYRNPRNPRHVDHITLEQIINDQIVKNPKTLSGVTQVHPVIASQTPTKSNSPVIAYHDLKIGQLIKDEELLRLILKALKWMEAPGQKFHSIDHWIRKLKQSKFRDVLSNPNLLHDSDLMQLLKSYVGQDALTLFSCNPVPYIPAPAANLLVPNSHTHHIELKQENCQNSRSPFLIQNEDSVTQMDVHVDPNLFLGDEDTEESDSVHKNEDCPEPNSVEVIIEMQQPESKKRRSECEKELKGRQKRRRKQELKAVDENLKQEVNKEVPIIIHTERRGRRPKLDNQDPKLACPVCKKILSTKGNLKVHMNTHKPKNKENKFSCPKCKKSFESQTVFDKHKDCPNESKFFCETCTRKFATKGSLSIHLLSHALEKSHDKRHKCTTCKKIFKKQKDLKSHQASHSTQEQHSCTHCSKSFTSVSQLETHKKRMHQNVDKISNKK